MCLSGVNIQLGKATMFHFNHPQEAAQLREKRKVGEIHSLLKLFVKNYVLKRCWIKGEQNYELMLKNASHQKLLSVVIAMPVGYVLLHAR